MQFGSLTVLLVLVVLAIILAGAAIVYGLVVPRALGSQTVGRTALVLSALGLVSVAAFWAGLPPLLGFGGVMLGWHVRASSAGKIAVALGVLAFVAYVAVYVTDLS